MFHDSGTHSAGHVNFQDEVSAALRAADGVLLVVDAVEGVMLVTEKVVRQALTEGLPICLLITKVHLASCHIPVNCKEAASLALERRLNLDDVAED